MRDETKKQVSQFIKELETRIVDAENRHKESTHQRDQATMDLEYLNELKQTLYKFDDSPKPGCEPVPFKY